MYLRIHLHYLQAPLTSGTTYYARVGTCTDYNYSAGLVAAGKANVSASIDVVTAPETGASKFVQTGATRTSFTGTFSGSFGANYYQIYYIDVLLGASTSTTVKTSRKLTPGTSYWTYAYPCRRSAPDILQEAPTDDYMKTCAEGSTRIHLELHLHLAILMHTLYGGFQ